MKILLMKISTQLIILDAIGTGWSNNEFTQVFQAIVSALHSLHHIRGIVIAIGRDFASAHAGCSLSMSNRPDTCDSLHVINLTSDVQYFFRGKRVSRYILAMYLMPRIYFVARHYAWSRGSYMYINFNELLWNYEFIITKIYFQ